MRCRVSRKLSGSESWLLCFQFAFSDNDIDTTLFIALSFVIKGLEGSS